MKGRSDMNVRWKLIKDIMGKLSLALIVSIKLKHILLKNKIVSLRSIKGFITVYW